MVGEYTATGCCRLPWLCTALLTAAVLCALPLLCSQDAVVTISRCRDLTPVGAARGTCFASVAQPTKISGVDALPLKDGPSLLTAAAKVTCP